MLQQMGKTTLRAMHKAVDPPMAAPSSLKNEGVDLTPAGLNFMSMDGMEKGEIKAIQQIQPQITVGRSVHLPFGPQAGLPDRRAAAQK